jgi:hypothetical protein
LKLAGENSRLSGVLRILFQRVWVWFLAGFIILQVPLALGIRHWQEGLSNEIRNPGHRRGWYEFVRATPAARPGEEVILLLSNSQGYGFEVPDRQIYANWLQTNLRVQERNARVVNWSVPGPTYFDFLVLAAAARDLKAVHILFVLTPGPLCEPTHPSLEGHHWTSDVHYLLHDRTLRQRLAADGLSHRLSAGIWADIHLGAMWPVWRWRAWIPSHLAQTQALRPLFPMEKDSAWIAPPTYYGRQRKPPLAPLNEAAARRLLDLLREASPGLIVVDMPLAESWRGPDPAQHQLRGITRELSIPHLNLEASIAEPHFITATHLGAQGHLEMARLLTGAIP